MSDIRSAEDVARDVLHGEGSHPCAMCYAHDLRAWEAEVRADERARVLAEFGREYRVLNGRREVRICCVWHPVGGDEG